jgi:hypothetical protein
MFFQILHAWQSFEVRVLGPKRCAMASCGSEHHTVRQRNAVFDGKASGLECCGAIEIKDATLLHDGDGTQGFIFAAGLPA